MHPVWRRGADPDPRPKSPSRAEPPRLPTTPYLPDTYVPATHHCCRPSPYPSLLLQALTLPITTAAGRLAMLGIMAFVAEQKIPGSVPALGSLGLKPYAGEVMAPFAAGNADLPYVSEMLGFTSLW